MTKRKAGPPGPAFRETVARKQPGPLEFRALLIASRKDTAPGKTVVPKSRATKLTESRPGLVVLRTWASHPIMSRRTNRAAALIPRCRPRRRDLVVERCEGNPFFAEELVRVLIDQELLHRAGGTWVGEGLPVLTLPDSVRALVAARIDLLGEDEKAALQAAAVIGRSFWSSPVYELLDGAEPDLRRLEERDFVRRQAESSLPGEREYTFKHALTCEVAYESVPKAVRARLHARFARWLEARCGGGDGYAALLAHHYAEAVRAEDVDLAWADDPAELDRLRRRAVDWLGRAGELAIGRYELDDGAELLRRALELAPDDPALWRRLGTAAALRYDGAEFCAAMERSLELEGDPAEQAEIVAELALHSAIRAGMWRTRPDRERAQGWLDRALEQTAPGTRARAMALSAQVYWTPLGAVDAAREASAIAERLGDEELLVYAAGARTAAALESFEFADAAAWAARRLELGESLGDPDLLVEGYEAAVAGISPQARFSEARALAQRHIELSRGLSPHHRVHGMAITLDVEELAGNWSAIERLTAQAEETVAANADTPCVRNVRSLLLCSLAAAHRGDELRARELEQAADAWQIEDFGLWGSEARLRLALVRRDLDTVARYADEPIDARAALGPAPLAALLDGWAALQRRERVEEAVPLVHGSAYLEPFGLRALGIVRGDVALIGEAAERFDALGLAWHAAETRRML